MRKLFISEVYAKSNLQAQEIAKWADAILRVDNGWMAFDSYASLKQYQEEQQEYSEWRKSNFNDLATTRAIVEGKA